MRKLNMFLMCMLVVSAMAQPTARQWNDEVTAGWNLGNQLECSPQGWNNESTSFGNPANAMQAETAWGNPQVTKQMLQAVKAAGFNAVRIPVRWQCHITDAATMTIDPEWMQRVKDVVGYCLDYDMKVIINTHHDMWLERRALYTYQTENNQKLELLWTQIANAFSDYDYRLAFAGTNEVHIKDNYNYPTNENLAVQNSYNQTFVDAVRSTGGNNLKRHLIVQTYNCNLSFGLNGFVIPNDIAGNGNDYMSVEFHYYEPWDYCGSGTYYYWGQAYSSYGATSNSKETTMRSNLQKAADTWGTKGLGIIIGEWGVTDHWLTTFKNVIRENMTYYCKLLVSEARQRGIATFVWDNNSFGNGTEKYGIFNRWSNMQLVAEWTLDGIQQGIAADMTLPIINNEHSLYTPRKVLKDGKVIIEKGEKYYNLQGQSIEKVHE